ncbi:hypothetical protein AB3569_06960 [Acinetobacter baumannii]
MNQANAELKKQNDLRNEYLKQHQTVLGAQQGETNELNNQVAAQEKLNKLRDNANKDILKNDFLIKTLRHLVVAKRVLIRRVRHQSFIPTIKFR